MAVSKRTGRKSLAANDFLIPLPPGPPTANDVGTNRPFDNGSAVVEFTPVDLAVSYKIYAASAGETTVTATGESSPIIITGLKSNILYTFTVTGFNSEGDEGAPSDPSTATLITTVPATPAAPTASSPNANQDVISWLAPATGGKTITGYVWDATDGKTNATGGTPGGGPTTNLSATVDQEAATSQTYSVYAINANGNSAISAESNSITTTFSFAPFGAFGFSPFGAFTFSPFNAFAFSPFNAFAFSPFMAFGFSPFAAFSFSPFYFYPFMAFSFAPFGFAPRCIASKTKISTINDYLEVVFIAAEDLKVGDKLISPTWTEYQGANFIDSQKEKVSYENMTDLNKKFVYVKEISSEIVTETVIFNNNPNKHFSTEQPVLVKKQGHGNFTWEVTANILSGDILLEYNAILNKYEELAIDNVHFITNSEETIYRITPDGQSAFIAGNIIVY
jgi:hypothetical protein